MNKTYKTYLALFVLVVIALVFLQISKKKLIDWSLNFETDEKSPFGLYVFNQEADKLFKNKLERITKSPYDFLSKDSTFQTANYLIIEKNVTAEGWNKLLERVYEGSNVFVISRHLPIYLSDTLKLYNYFSFVEDGAVLKINQKRLENDSVLLTKSFYNSVMTDVEIESSEILGYEKRNSEKLANFIKLKRGKGNLFVHTNPMPLTNYYLLKDKNYRYSQNVFSFLPDKKTYWFQEENLLAKTSNSPLRFILQYPALRYAWYLSLLGLLVFMFFNAKRKQRVVPIIEPPVNSSVEFVKSIGNLYLQEGNIKDMASKKATYFLNKIRTDLMINTNKLDKDFAEKIQLKTGASLKDIEKVMPLIEKATHPKAPVQEDELIELNKLLDKIYH